MFYLILSIVASSMLTLVMRHSEGRMKSKTGMLAANYVICMLLAAIFIGPGNLLPQTEGIGPVLGMGAINGFFYMISLVIMQQNIKHNGVVLPSVFSRLGGLVVPLGVAIVLFSEIPKTTQTIGSVLALLSILIISYEKQQTKASAKWLLFLMFITDGMAAVMSKVFEQTANQALSDHFLLYTFAAALILCIAVILYNKEKIGLIDVIYGICVGVPNFFASRFMLQALSELPAVVVYPIRGVGGIVLIALVGVLFFKEKLKKHQWLAMIVVLAAVALLNL